MPPADVDPHAAARGVDHHGCAFELAVCGSPRCYLVSGPLGQGGRWRRYPGDVLYTRRARLADHLCGGRID
jgi:hypothetical protein